MGGLCCVVLCCVVVHSECLFGPQYLKTTLCNSLTVTSFLVSASLETDHQCVVTQFLEMKFATFTNSDYPNMEMVHMDEKNF